jgi:hypothetical protein
MVFFLTCGSVFLPLSTAEQVQTQAQAQAGDAAAVTVNVEQRQHVLITQPTKSTSHHPAFEPALAEEIAQLRREIKALERPLFRELKAKHPEIYEAAKVARQAGDGPTIDRLRVARGKLETATRQAHPDVMALHQQLASLQARGQRRENITFTAITLKNAYLEVVVAPELGMRILNAIDRK